MVRRIWSYIRQHETHRELVGRPRTGAWRASGAPLDAIIVPASRPAAYLDSAVTLAGTARCKLVVFCSLDAQSADVMKLLASRRFTQAVVIDVSPGYRHPLLSFQTSELAREALPKGCANPNGDLSMKRNLGLILARMAGWNRIFFMDDDISALAPADLRATVSMLDSYRCAGLRVEDFPDNSVVCHARREVGDRQDVFVTGSVLAVNCAQPVSFFPEIYNEDWFFFYDDVRAGRVGQSLRSAGQLKYDPFSNPRRARQQEFGDLLAEGLYALIHLEAGHKEATRDYWANFIAARRRLIADIKKRAGQLLPADRRRIVSALDGAIACLMKIHPRTCESYVSAWRDDLDTWQRRLAGVSAAGSVEAALRELGLNQAAGWKTASAAVSDPDLLAPSPEAAALDLLLGTGMSVPRLDRSRLGRVLRRKA